MSNKLLVAIIVDPMGTMMSSAEEEVEEYKQSFKSILAPRKVEFYRALHCGDNADHGIKSGTDLVIYDFGGMLPGNDLMASNARELIRWCENNPGRLAIVISSHTYKHHILYELEELGLSEMNNLINFWGGDGEEKLLSWFSEEPKLPALRFFEPTNKFTSWLAKHVGKRILIDAGCGEGHLGKLLEAKGTKVIGIDIFKREGQGPSIIQLDATKFRYPKDSVVIFARPCHSSWVEKSIERAVDCQVVDIFYVGLLKNVKDDLGYWYRHFQRVGKNTGKDGEYVWRLDQFQL